MQYIKFVSALNRVLRALSVIVIMAGGTPARAADLGFTQFIGSLWPEAQAAGVSRATFDAETRGLEPDYQLPDLILPGRPATGAPSQAEFVQVPADYLKEASIGRLAAEGQRLMQKHHTALAAIEARFGVPGSIVLAIWGRETDYGRRDIWHSVPDALASAAQQLVNKGWQSGVRWAYEVRAPASVDCTLGVPEVTKSIAQWLREGFVPVRGQKLSATEQAQPASLLQPEGIYGPAFLTTRNYFVIKE